MTRLTTFRLTAISTVLGSGLALGGCSMFSSDSDTPSSSNSVARGEGYGTNSQTTTNRGTTTNVQASTATGTATNTSARPVVHGNTNPPDMDRRNDGVSRSEPTITRTTSWGDQSWNDRDVVMVNESDIPSSARMGLVREAGGSTMSETGRGTWNGQKAYCARVSRGGRDYKVVTDADGHLISMNRIE